MKKHSLVKGFVSLVFMLCLLITFSSPVQGATTYFVTNTTSSGAGSLRQAILSANANPGQDTIAFNIPTSDPGYASPLGVWVFHLTTVLPMLEDPSGVIIDGSTQPGYNPDLPGLIVEHTDSILVGADLLTIVSSNNTVKNLGLFLSRGDGIVLQGSSNYIQDNQIFSSAGYGIYFGAGADSNIVYGNNICGHTLDAIRLFNANGAIIENNIIGVLPSYYAPAGRNQANGITLLGSNNNVIDHNVISYNMQIGVQLNQSITNTIIDNTIGLDDSRTIDLGNGGHGLELLDSSNNSVTENWISGNESDGIRLTGSLSMGNIVQQNWIGTAYSAPIPNAHHGIALYDGAHQNTIGSDSDAELYNVVLGNGWSGIVVVDSPLGANVIGNNSIYSQGFYGIHINNSPGNAIVSNRVAGNGVLGNSAGVRVENSSGISDTTDYNLLWSNQIFNNYGKGIQLVGDANNNISRPIILSASCSQVSGTACPDCWVQVFSDLYDEGRYYDGLTTADGSGHFSVAIHATGQIITAVAIDVPGNSSEFSLAYTACFRVSLPILMK